MPCIFKNPIRERGKRQNILTYRFAFQPVKLKIALMFGAHNKLPWDYFNKNSGLAQKRSLVTVCAMLWESSK